MTAELLLISDFNHFFQKIVDDSTEDEFIGITQNK